METSHNKVKIKFGSKVQISNGQNWCNVLLMEDVTVYGHDPERYVKFGRGGPNILW